MTALYIALIVVGIMVILRLAGCGPRCQIPKKPRQTKKSRSYTEEKEKIREKIKNVKTRKDESLKWFENYGKEEKK